ncbi:MAG: helix-turn-helix domain-containing protein [Treponemataceae bacterium]
MEKLTAQERVFEIIDYLYKNHIKGLTNKELAKLIGTSDVNICRDLAVFEKYGWIQRDDDGKCRLSSVFGSISAEILKNYKKARLELSKAEAEFIGAVN